jgi:cell division protein FtsI (penicillin-binding protein 3)
LETGWVLRRRFERKTSLILGVFLVLSLAAVLRILDLQITKRSEIAREIEARFERVTTARVPVYRGSIKDTNGREIALSVPTLTVYVHPDTRYLKNREEFVRGLSSLTGLPRKLIEERLRSGSGRPVKLLSGVSRELKEKIRELIVRTGNAPFVGIQEDYTRVYPNGTLASNLIGFVGVDGVGLEGMEFALNEYLGGGYTEALIYMNGGLGQIYLHPLEGMMGEENDVSLTIDIGVQHLIERIRDEIVRRWKPKKVSILVMDLKNGHILGLATYPYFDPNRFQAYRAERRRNFAVTDVFEPGSIMKPFFVAWALEKGYVKPNMVVDTGKGRIKVYDRYVRDPRRLGRIRLKDVLVHSSNVGTIKVASFLKRKDVEEMLEAFHMKRRFGIFPGEANPLIPDFSYPANILYASIGQGIAMNTLNIAVAFGGLTTGYIIQPHIVKEIVSPSGGVLYRAERRIIRRDVLSKETVMWIRRALMEVVERGTGRRARSRYFTIAGKTGTSQKFDPKEGRYSRDRVVTYFAGVFPATDPRFVGVIVVDEPKGRRLYGGEVSAPYFKKLAENLSFYYGLKPDKVKKG